MDEIITLDYGSGGKKTSRLIESMIVPALANPALSELGDGAVIPGADKLVFSTDSFVVDPIFFSGGSIGKLSVCGTVNDIAMCGGEPKYLSCAFIIEEGFPAAELACVVEAIREAGEKAGVQVVDRGYEGSRARPRRQDIYQHRRHRLSEISGTQPEGNTRGRQGHRLRNRR